MRRQRTGEPGVSDCGTDAGRIKRKLFPAAWELTATEVEAAPFLVISDANKGADCRHSGKLSQRFLPAVQGSLFAQHSVSRAAEGKENLRGPAQGNLDGAFRRTGPAARRTVVGAIRKAIPQSDSASGGIHRLSMVPGFG